ncbi:cation diffusion facilitator family transporter [Vibrio natriegens]|jgi:cation diffusion facilitator family transporter|uniref:Cobalt-zinc-cadmium resistance protein n=1 Tax=Vibrio natriegens NBRC 15636 = ATCC 14048 = DSM 759 TaxID=1219067 RepID=A0AAN0Y7P3_VIBNA|nr:cation diffusion facilitator family transporter [Vibrio natriegens]ALR18667.1 cobalt-zinc-cadmium resistance protein [Vibrio natriegens NBRC 15636 = ATCC 14048 = DSM 759]ANQ14635.1 cobalt-zinc-cadmium resistance protein [Vibrio natriegens NBRC 15636 = ATCC 14048 = DSM 759]EPM39671.1 cobalt-zinc-cadmium resistance protein [Vibrio natriegens NBRC 15636 = ATCC 14048 = DSM 759]MDX6028403.1 cation diffusion facilitator family transporter [Vibrio natriegens NBRC 15636 = ATCC 14048 = DSM 759]UUI13
MCVRTSKNENHILTISALLASGFAAGGMVLGLLVGSIVIVFDGVYSLVSLLLTLLSLAASYYISKPSKSVFPFGKAVLEPIVIAIKATVILIVVLFSLYSAISALMTGGREVDASIATIFGVVNVLGCGYAWWFMAKRSRNYSSGLIEAETKQWQMDTLLSVAVTVGFVAAWLVSLSPFAQYAAYADPLMMLLMGFYFLKVPFDMLCGALRELLMMTPSKELCQVVGNDVLEIEKVSDHQLKVAGITKVGQELRVNIDLHVDDDTLELDTLEKTRKQLTTRLSKHRFKLQLQLNVA